MDDESWMMDGGSCMTDAGLWMIMVRMMINNDDDDDKNKHHGDLCKYYTNKCCQKTCLGTIVKSHFKRWLIVASGTLLLFIGTIIG